MKLGTEVKWQGKLPTCDICSDVQATYDGKTVKGGWAYMCYDCFVLLGVGIGLGRGQKLIAQGQEVKK